VISGTSAPAPVASPHGDEILRVEHLKVYFPVRRGVLQRRVGWVHAVDDVSFNVRRGETLGLVGESGCGKSTTARAIPYLIRPTAGSVHFEDIELGHARPRDLVRVRRQMQIIFQDPNASLDFRMTVGSSIAEGLDIHHLGDRDQRRHRVSELLEVVGLDPAMAGRFPHEFSGGQRQRIGIARALALSPSLVVCDEPISALDVSIQAQVINLLQELQERFRLTYLFISHDLSVVRHISDRIAVMYLGKVVELSPARELYDEPRHPYTVALLSAVRIPDPSVESRRRRVILTGDVPSPADPPRGCRFHPRCWLRERLGSPIRCAEEEPALRPISDGHTTACHYAEQVAGLSAELHLTGQGSTDESLPILPPVELSTN